MNAFLTESSIPLQNISHRYPQVQSVDVLRLDLLHPVISGNKWFKLRYYLADATEQKKSTIVTMGGAWSNHLVATAATCAQMGFRSIGLVRGEEPKQYSATLLKAKELGMKLVFLPREEFDQGEPAANWLSHDHYFIPAGGFGEKGAKGAAGILDITEKQYDFIICAVGTGTTLAGLISHACRTQQLLGISALKGHPELEENIQSLCTTSFNNWRILRDFHFGGYARYDSYLLQFMNKFYAETGIPSDFVYTGKLFFAFHTLVQEGYFPSAASILLIHSGGLQGNNSLTNGELAF
jgi:1-aminocyclopropane-1-carboxylate deaminase